MKYDTKHLLAYGGLRLHQRAFCGPAKMAFLLLGEAACYTPNVFSKKCCGDVDCLGKQSLCKKAVPRGSKPTTDCCWRASYRWHLERSRKMLRIVEHTGLGEGQKIEQALAEDIGDIEVREIHIDDNIQKMVSRGRLLAGSMELGWHIEKLLRSAGFDVRDGKVEELYRRALLYGWALPSR